MLRFRICDRYWAQLRAAKPKLGQVANLANSLRTVLWQLSPRMTNKKQSRAARNSARAFYGKCHKGCSTPSVCCIRTYALCPVRCEAPCVRGKHWINKTTATGGWQLEVSTRTHTHTFKVFVFTLVSWQLMGQRVHWEKSCYYKLKGFPTYSKIVTNLLDLL